MDGIDPNDIAARAGLDISAVKVADQSTLDELARAEVVTGTDVLRSESEVGIPTQTADFDEAAVVGSVAAEATLQITGSEEYRNGISAQKIFLAVKDGDIDSALDELVGITDERILPLIGMELKKGIKKFLENMVANAGETDVVTSPVFESARTKAQAMPEELGSMALGVIDDLEAASILHATELDLAMKFILCTRILSRPMRIDTMVNVAFLDFQDTGMSDRETRIEQITPLLEGLGASGDAIQELRSCILSSSGGVPKYQIPSIRAQLRAILDSLSKA